MTETRNNLICFSDVERFLVKSYKRITGGCEFDIEKYGPWLDVAKKILVPSLEKHIIYCLEIFVYNDNITNDLSKFSNFHNNCDNFFINYESKRRFYDVSSMIIKNIMTRENFLYLIENSTLLTNSRIERIARQLDSVKFTEKNYLRYWNVVNYLDNYDYDFDTKKKNYSSDDDSTELTGSLSRSTSQSSLINDLKNCLSKKKKSKGLSINLKDEKSDGEIFSTKNTASSCLNLIGDRMIDGIGFKKNSEIIKLFVRKKILNRTRNLSDENFDHFNDFISFPLRVEEILRKLRKVDPFLGILKNRCRCYKMDKIFYKKLANFCLNIDNRSKDNELCLNQITKKKGKKLYCDIREDYLILKFQNSESFSYTARIPTNKFDRLKNHRRYFNENNYNPIVNSTIKRSNDGIRISDIIKRLELSPYRFEEAKESVKLRSKIREIVRSIILCKNKNDPSSSVLSVEAIVENNSISETSFTKACGRSEDGMSCTVPHNSLSKNNGRKLYNEKESTVFKEKNSLTEMSFPKACGKSGDGMSCTVPHDSLSKNDGRKLYNEKESTVFKEKNSLTDMSLTKACDKSGDGMSCTVRHDSEIKENGKKLDNNKRRIIRDDLSSKNEFEIDLTVEIEDLDSDESSTSLSRHTHLLPSMITVGLSCARCREDDDYNNDMKKKKSIISLSRNSSKSCSIKLLKNDGETSMGKSMYAIKNRRTISERSYKKLSNLIEKENLSDNKTKNKKYSICMQSSNTDIQSRQILAIRNEISESSSSMTDEEGEKFEKNAAISSSKNNNNNNNCEKNDERTFSELSSTGSFCGSSKCANFDLRSMHAYACVDDRISNKRLKNIIIDYYDYNDDEDEESLSDDKFVYKFSNDVEISRSCSNLDSVYNISSSNNCSVSDFCYDEISNSIDDETSVFHKREKKSDSKLDSKSSSSDCFHTFDQFDGIGRHPVATRWSTCAIRSASPLLKIKEFQLNDETIKSSRFIKYKDRNRNRFNKHCRKKKSNFRNISLIGVIADFNYKKLFNKIDESVGDKILKFLKFFKNSLKHTTK